MNEFDIELNKKFKKLGYQEPEKLVGPDFKFTSPWFGRNLDYLRKQVSNYTLSLDALKQISNRTYDAIRDPGVNIDDVGQMMYALEWAASTYNPKSRKEKRVLKKMFTAPNYDQNEEVHYFEDDMIVDPIWSFAGHRLANRPMTQLLVSLGLGYLGGSVGVSELTQLSDMGMVAGFISSPLTAMGWEKVREYLESKRVLQAYSIADFMDKVNKTNNSVVTLNPTSVKKGHFVEMKSEGGGFSDGATYRKFVHTGYDFYTLWECQASKGRTIIFKDSKSNFKNEDFASATQKAQQQHQKYPYMDLFINGTEGVQEYGYYLDKIVGLDDSHPYQKARLIADLSVARNNRCGYPESRYEVCRV